MQEEITQRTVSISVEAGKMTADLLQKAVKKVLEEMQKKPSQRSLHQGKQTLHQLKQHGASLTNIEITEQNIKAFSAVAKKYDISYTGLHPKLIWHRTKTLGRGDDRCDFCMKIMK